MKAMEEGLVRDFLNEPYDVLFPLAGFLGCCSLSPSFNRRGPARDVGPCGRHEVACGEVPVENGGQAEATPSIPSRWAAFLPRGRAC
jgi:hypothetical protein